MFTKMAFVSLLASASVSVFAQDNKDVGAEVLKRVDMENINMRTELACKQLGETVATAIKDATKDVDVNRVNDTDVRRQLRTLTNSQKRILSSPLNCAHVVKVIAEMREQLGPNYIPFGIFKISGTEINVKSFGKGAKAVNMGARGFLGLGGFFPFNGELIPQMPKLAAIVIANPNLSVHASDHKLSFLTEEKGWVVVFSPTGQFKSVSSLSNVYATGSIDTGISNSKIESTSRGYRFMAPVMGQGGSFSDINWEDFQNPKVFATKLLDAVVGQKPVLGIRSTGKGNDADVTQIGIGGAYVHVEEIKL